MSKNYRQWVAQYQDEAWSLARFLLKDGSEAEDATQEAFTSLWRHREAIAEESVKAWLMKATRNECFDRLRRRRPQTELQESHSVEEGGPMTVLQQGQLATTLARAIASLGEPYRSLVVLRDVQQQSYEAVSATLNLSLSQVKVYLYRARKQLREQLVELKP